MLRSPYHYDRGLAFKPNEKTSAAWLNWYYNDCAFKYISENIKQLYGMVFWAGWRQQREMIPAALSPSSDA